MIDSIGIRFLPQEDPTDPMWIVPGSPVDAPVLQGPLTRARREDLQAYSFLLALGLSGGQHPLGLRPGADPPDRELLAGDQVWALELTEMTAQDVRQELAQVRAAGRQLQDTLRADAGFSHLAGRRVALAFVPQVGEALPKDMTATIAAVAEVLASDLGCVGDGIDFSAGPPDPWPNSAGFYGSHGPFTVTIHRDGDEGQITVSAAAQAQMRRSEALAALQARVSAKDNSANSLLLVTSGLPDQAGYTCPLDHFIFQFIADSVSSAGPLLLTTNHLSAVALHHWGTAEWVEVHRAGDARIPWPPTSVTPPS